MRDALAPTVRYFLRSGTRYQASKLGGRVHHDAEGVMAAGDGAREVARELLGATVEILVTVTKTAGAVQISALAGLTRTGLSMLFD